MVPCLSLLCFMVFGPPALVLGEPMPAASPRLAPSIQAFGRANACGGWTDGCTICTGVAGAPAACSMPGIACTPGPIVCTAKP